MDDTTAAQWYNQDRAKVALGQVSRNFYAFMLKCYTTGERLVRLNRICDNLAIRRRRLYDVINVLETLGLVKRDNAATVSLTDKAILLQLNPRPYLRTSEGDEQISRLKSELRDLRERECVLDKDMLAATELFHHYHSYVEGSTYYYLTREEIVGHMRHLSTAMSIHVTSDATIRRRCVISTVMDDANAFRTKMFCNKKSHQLHIASNKAVESLLIHGNLLTGDTPRRLASLSKNGDMNRDVSPVKASRRYVKTPQLPLSPSHIYIENNNVNPNLSHVQASRRYVRPPASVNMQQRWEFESTDSKVQMMLTNDSLADDIKKEECYDDYGIDKNCLQANHINNENGDVKPSVHVYNGNGVHFCDINFNNYNGSDHIYNTNIDKPAVAIDGVQHKTIYLNNINYNTISTASMSDPNLHIGRTDNLITSRKLDEECNNNVPDYAGPRRKNGAVSLLKRKLPITWATNKLPTWGSNTINPEVKRRMLLSASAVPSLQTETAF